MESTRFWHVLDEIYIHTSFILPSRLSNVVRLASETCLCFIILVHCNQSQKTFGTKILVCSKEKYIIIE